MLLNTQQEVNKFTLETGYAYYVIKSGKSRESQLPATCQAKSLNFGFLQEKLFKMALSDQDVQKQVCISLSLYALTNK